MDPIEGADAAFIGACGEVCGDGEVSEAVPDAGMVGAEDHEVFGVDGGDVGVVGDAEGAAADVLEVVGVEGGGGGAGAGVVAVLDVAAGVGGVVGGCTLVAGDLAVVDAACGELHEFTVVGREVEMVVEPPLFEGEVHERDDGSVVVVEVGGGCGDVEAPHALIPETCCRGRRRRRCESAKEERRRGSIQACPETRVEEAARRAARRKECFVCIVACSTV